MPKSKKSDSEKSSKDKAKKSEKAAKPKKAPAKKPAAPRAARTVTPKITIPIEEISLRAYYIAERRKVMGWDGDSTSDWIEAERQLKAETSKKAKS